MPGTVVAWVKPNKCRCGCVGQDGQAQAPGALASDFDRDAAQRLLAGVTAAFEAVLVATEVELVDPSSAARPNHGAIGIASPACCGSTASA